MKRLSWGAWCLILGLVVFAVDLPAPSWCWAIRGQMDVLTGRVRLEPQWAFSHGGLRRASDGEIAARLLIWPAKARTRGDAPLFSSPRNVDEQVANALWIPDASACLAQLRSIAGRNPRSLTAQAMVVSHMGPLRSDGLEVGHGFHLGGGYQPRSAVDAAAHRGQALDPDNAFWPLEETDNRIAIPPRSQICEALIRAGEAKRYEIPRVDFVPGLFQAVQKALGRGNLAAAWALRMHYPWSPMVFDSVRSLGDDDESFRARVGIIKADRMRLKSGSFLDIVSATLEIDMAATGPRPKGAFRKHQSALDALRAFQQRVAARHVAPGLDVVQTWREAYRLEKVAGAMVKARPKWDLPSVDYDLLGVAALSAAFAVLVCAEFASILRRTRTRWGLRRFAPIAAACLASCAVALGGNHFAWIPALLLAVAVPFLATGRRLPTILLTGSALLCCAAGLSYDGVLAVPPAVFALVWPGGVLPETGNAWAVTVRAVLFAVLAAVAGCWIACLLIGFGSPLWVFPPVAGIIALTPRGYPRALQFMGPAVLCCALAHVSFLVADGRQDARYAGAVLRDMKDESDLADRARAKAETMPLPAEP